MKHGVRRTLLAWAVCAGTAVLCPGCPPDTRAGSPVQEVPAREGARSEPAPFDATPLHRAARLGDAQTVAALLEQGADRQARDDEGWTPLHWAAHLGHRDVAELLLTGALNGEGANSPDNFGRTPLHLAAAAGHAELVSLLVIEGADPSVAAAEGLTPMHLAACFGQDDTVRVLIESGAEVNARDEFGQTPLALAQLGLGETHAKPIAALLQRAGGRGTPLSEGSAAPTDELHTVLSRRAGHDFSPSTRHVPPPDARADAAELAEVERLLAAGAGPDRPDRMQVTPLLKVAATGNAPAALALLEHGADPNAVRFPGFTAVQTAAGRGHADVLRALLEHGADPNLRDPHDSPALIYAIRGDHVRCVELLLEHGANPNAHGQHLQTPLEYVLDHMPDESEMTTLLLEHGASLPEQKWWPGLLQRAIDSGNAERVALLLDAGMDPNMKSQSGSTMLFDAARRGREEVLRVMLERGGDPNAVCVAGSSLLYMSIQERSPRLVELLIEHGADLSKDGPRVIERAIRLDDAATVRLLFKETGTSESVDAKMRAAFLMVAVTANAPASMEALLESGADPNEGFIPWVIGVFAQVCSLAVELVASRAHVRGRVVGVELLADAEGHVRIHGCVAQALEVRPQFLAAGDGVEPCEVVHVQVRVGVHACSEC